MRKRSIAFGAVLAAVLVAAAGIAYAQLRTSSNEIRACVQKDGAMRRVGPTTRCAVGEQSLMWNIRGAKGEPGPAGPQGLQGPTGPQGPQGLPGTSAGGTTSGCMMASEFAPAYTGSTSIESGSWIEGGGCMLGEIRLFAGGFAPRGWAVAAGQLINISDHSALFSVFGTMYGGNGTSTFALPDLRNASPSATVYIICTAGVFPARS